MNERCCLVLADGTEFYGRSFGAAPTEALTLQPDDEKSKSAGEVVFNTGMCGYHEILTDPSYTGQIITMTYPLIGNYGVDESWNEVGPEQESRPRVKAAGFVVRKLYEGPLPARRERLSSFLERNGTPGMQDVDTRALTLKLRDEGSVNGVIVRVTGGDSLSVEERDRCRAYLGTFPPMEGRNLIGNVGTSESSCTESAGTVTFVLVDCGIKANIIRELEKREVRVVVLPSAATVTEILAERPDAVLFSNGPGDPAVLGAIVSRIGELIGKVPVFGICLGHQLIAQAIGAKTRKMMFGHHGVNHPVRDEGTGKVFVTSQNHGFDVLESSLRKDATVWFRNANDGTIEGIRIDSLRVSSVQFHPEAAPGPRDSSWIFDSFVRAASGEES